jgi:uncharacterized protein (DUF488 family)
MLYTVGYQHHTPETLRNLLDSLQVDLLVDVRSSPRSRKRGFGRAKLEGYFGKRYQWRGDRLGGRGAGPTKAGLDELARDRRTLMLMCMEEAPGDCHRHGSIAVRLLPRLDVCHVFRDQVIRASSLEACIEGRRAGNKDAEYEYTDL